MRYIGLGLLLIGCSGTPTEPRERAPDPLFQLVCVDSLAAPPPGYHCSVRVGSVQIVVKNPTVPDTTSS